MQKFFEEAFKAHQAATANGQHETGVPYTIVIIIVAGLVSALGALWLYLRALNKKLDNSRKETIKDLNDRLTKSDERSKKAEDLLDKLEPNKATDEIFKMLRERVESLEKSMEAQREEHSKEAERRRAEN